VDFGPHLGGGGGKHDAGEIDVEGTYSNISGTPTDLETAISAIDSALGDALDNGLDDAYNNGVSITTDNGAVKLDRAAATNAAFEIVPKAAVPSTGEAVGQVHFDTDGSVYLYDATRDKWLSLERWHIIFDGDRRTRAEWLKNNGNYTNEIGVHIPKDACIVGIWIRIATADTGDTHIRRNDVATDILTISLAAATNGKNTAADVNVDADDYLQAYNDTPNPGYRYPKCIIELAWRKDAV